MTSSASVRAGLAATLRRDLIGPMPGEASLEREALPSRPSRWYLTGWLVPTGAPLEQRAGSAGEEGDLGTGQAEGDGMDDDGGDPVAPPSAFLPSSIGLSVFVPEDCETIEARATWGDYQPELVENTAAGSTVDDPGSEPLPEQPDGEQEVAASDESQGQHPVAVAGAGGGLQRRLWRRTQGDVHVALALPEGVSRQELPGTSGLAFVAHVRPAVVGPNGAKRRVKAVSVFLVNNRRALRERHLADAAFAFQAAIELHRKDTGFVPRPDPRGIDSIDWDTRVGDLHYADVAEIAVGHNVSADWSFDEDGVCRKACSVWMPQAMVPRVEPNRTIPGVFGMETLGALPDAAAARAALDPIPRAYLQWITDRRNELGPLLPRRREVAEELLKRAAAASRRIEAGIELLAADAQAFEAFRLANRTLAAAARRRRAQQARRNGQPFDPGAGTEPAWYPFQLAFLLLNLRGLADPTHAEREWVELLFFPTGGGKTEAYLGLAAFTIGLRRLRHPGLGGAGLAVLMRYTLRLLTLDQLSRAAAVVCALELERQVDPVRWGDWPIEIALWVGSAATPNRMGEKGKPDPKRRTARTRTLDFKAGRKDRNPVPLGACPWCGSSFTENSLDLKPNSDAPRRLDLLCVDPTRTCDFHTSRGRPLPVQAVDEPIYRRLPAFMIATVDKFAAMPWTGEVAAFFGGADRHDAEGFYGPAEPHRGQPLPAPLPPPDLIIQDELHLISGPLGSMVGLYETAIDALATRQVGDTRVRPKIVASTATVRAAASQVRALFDRPVVQLFPPPGVSRADSFFARSRDIHDSSGRLYLGIAAPGGSPKVVFLRTAVTLLSAAQHAHLADANAADPYMTLLCYFNALRELGGARRIVEGEVGPRLEKYGRRRRVGETDADAGLAGRHIAFDVVELTSRVSTADVAEAKERLAAAFSSSRRVDVALATNMISVGLDITRLGLMLVSGQPKTVSEYIQATSRVGREDTRPGLVLALLNMNKPRDRSHYERFRPWHEAFYRGVEATSVTPFSPRALDRGLAAVTVAMARLGVALLAPPGGAAGIKRARPAADAFAHAAGHRAGRHGEGINAPLDAEVRRVVTALMDDWQRIADRVADAGGSLAYDARSGRPLLREMLDPELPRLPIDERRFRAARSLRDVEPPVLVRVLTPTGEEIS